MKQVNQNRLCFAGWLIPGLIIWIVQCVLLPSSARADESLEQFRRLLSQPPILERLVYSQTIPNVGHWAVSFDTGLNGATNKEYFELRWQTNAVFHRQLASATGWNNDQILGRCFSVWYDHFYFLDARTRPSLYVLEREKAALGEFPGPFHAAHIRLIEAVEPMNLGICHAYPGTVRWNGNSFNAKSMADLKPIWISGHISNFSNGIPSEVRVAYSNDVNVARYRITYDYTLPDVLPYPTRIASYFQRGEREVFYAEWFILLAKTAKEPMPESHYIGCLGRVAPAERLLLLTNDSTYARLPSGRLTEVPTGLSWNEGTSGRGVKSRRIYYLAAAAWTILCCSGGLWYLRIAQSTARATSNS